MCVCVCVFLGVDHRFINVQIQIGIGMVSGWIFMLASENCQEGDSAARQSQTQDGISTCRVASSWQLPPLSKVQRPSQPPSNCRGCGGCASSVRCRYPVHWAKPGLKLAIVLILLKITCRGSAATACNWDLDVLCCLLRFGFKCLSHNQRHQRCNPRRAILGSLW